MGKYFDELTRAMNWLAEKPETFFLGQAVCADGTGMTNTLKGVDISKRLEFPVCEDFQMGVSNGLALAGRIPVSIFPRWDFLVLATNQIVNHLDRFIEISDYKPKVIIRTGVGSVRPLDPHAQHRNDYTYAFQLMLRNIEVIRLEQPEDIFPAYEKAYTRTDGKSTIIVEVSDYLGEK